jgi:tRNA(adenine34) deaminase
MPFKLAADNAHEVSCRGWKRGSASGNSVGMTFRLPMGMQIAFDEAIAAAAAGEVPVGACIVSPQGDVLARAGNRTLRDTDPTAHAELLVLRQAAAKLGSERLTDCNLYVTLEPCAMCAGAISHARVRRVYFAADDAKMGAVEHGPRFFAQSTCHHAPEVYGGIGAEAASQMLKDFFKSRR